MRVSSRATLLILCAVALAMAGGWVVSAQLSGDGLEQGFLNPPSSAKPRVWWHWMNGNITKEGIKADLEWMNRVGIGGFQNFDAALNTPQVVEKRLVYMTPEWKDAFKYATTLADQLGLEMAIAASPGWSESGGPWVPPSQAMKKFVWSETRVEGGRPFAGVLAKPPSTVGPYQNAAITGRPGEVWKPPEPYYADAAVVGFRVPDADQPMGKLQPKVTSSGGAFSLAALTDGDVAQATLLPAAPVDQKAWVQFEFAKPPLVRGITVITAGGRGLGGRGSSESDQALEAGDDGVQFRVVASIPVGARTIAFAPVTARFFRLTIRTRAQTAGRGGAGGAGQGTVAPPAGTQISELVLRTTGWVNRVEEKAAFSPVAG